MQFHNCSDPHLWKADYCDVGNQEIRSVAASALGAYLAQHQVPPAFKGWNRYTVLQGFAMGWPSVIHSEIQIQGGVIAGTRVRGSACLV